MANPPNDARRSAAERIERGIELYGEGDLDGAIHAFEAALALVPGHERAQRCLAWVRDLSRGSGRVERVEPPAAGGQEAETETRSELWDEALAVTISSTQLAEALPRLPASDPSVPRKTISSSTILGLPAIDPPTLSPRKLLADADQTDDRPESVTREFTVIPTGHNLPPLDVPELTDEQIAELIALESGAPELPRSGRTTAVDLAGAGRAVNDTSYLELEAEPPPGRGPRDTNVDAIEPLPDRLPTGGGFELPDTTPVSPIRLLGDEVVRAPSSFRELAPLPLDATELPELTRSIPEDELPSVPTNPFIKGPRLREYASFSSPVISAAASPPNPLVAALEALERGDLVSAVDAVERAIADGGGMDAAPMRPHHATLERVYEAAVGPLDHVPAHGESPADLDPRAAFLLSRLDGTLTVEDLLDVSGMRRLEALRVLALLVHRGTVVLR